MLIPILSLVALVVIIFAVIVARKPDDFRVTRSALITAPPASVFTLVNDFHHWQIWSPWAKMDPNAKNTFEGTPAGPGATFAWDGNNKVGAGKMTILESRPNDLIRMKIEFSRPFAGTNAVEFTFVPEGAQTKVTWTMTGKFIFITKLFSVVMSMDKMVGKDFEKGLANIKMTAESAKSA